MDFNLPIMNSRDVLKNRTTMSTWEGVRETRAIGFYFYLLMNFYFFIISLSSGDDVSPSNGEVEYKYLTRSKFSSMFLTGLNCLEHMNMLVLYLGLVMIQHLSVKV